MKHGTTYMYKTEGCRCDECRAALAAYMRDYRRRRVVADVGVSYSTRLHELLDELLEVIAA
jgi:hypothetical protein